MGNVTGSNSKESNGEVPNIPEEQAINTSVNQNENMASLTDSKEVNSDSILSKIKLSNPDVKTASFSSIETSEVDEKVASAQPQIPYIPSFNQNEKMTSLKDSKEVDKNLILNKIKMANPKVKTVPLGLMETSKPDEKVEFAQTQIPYIPSVNQKWNMTENDDSSLLKSTVKIEKKYGSGAKYIKLVNTDTGKTISYEYQTKGGHVFYQRNLPQPKMKYLNKKTGKKVTTWNSGLSVTEYLEPEEHKNDPSVFNN